MPNRTLCSVLDEMRSCIKTLNFSYLKSLIEEAQTLGNRMEASLWDQKDLQDLNNRISKLKKEIKDLESQKESLEA